MSLLFRPRFVYGLPGVDDAYDRSFASVGSMLVDRPQHRPRGSSSDVMRSFPYLVYCDSRDPNSAAQQLKWCRYGFLPKDRTLFVSRLYPSVAREQIRQLEEQRVNYLLFWPLDVIDTSHARAVFYPYHTNTNQIVIKQPGPVHVFLGHGDSDKAGSINPMTRMYDHVFVAGDLTIQRLVEARMFTAHDARHGRGIRVGMPYLQPMDEQSLVAPQDGYLLYAPTWEGVERRQQYSSLEAGFGSDLVDALLRDTELEVVFRPHPSTGQKVTEYATLAAALITRHAAHPRFHVQGDLGGTCPGPRFLDRKTKYTAQCTPSDSLAGARWVITDVSSMLSSALYMGRPVACVIKRFLPDQQFRADVLSSEVDLTIEHGQQLDPSFAARFVDESAYHRAVERTRSARARAISLEPYLAPIPLAGRLDAIVERMADSEYRR